MTNEKTIECLEKLFGDGKITYKGLTIIKSDHGCYQIIEDWDYFQVPPFESIEQAKAYIDAGGDGCVPPDDKQIEILRRIFPGYGY